MQMLIWHYNSTSLCPKYFQSEQIKLEYADDSEKIEPLDLKLKHYNLMVKKRFTQFGIKQTSHLNLEEDTQYDLSITFLRIYLLRTKFDFNDWMKLIFGSYCNNS